MAELPAVNKEDLDKQTSILDAGLEDINHNVVQSAKILDTISGYMNAMVKMDKAALKRAMAQKGFNLEKEREAGRDGDDDKPKKGLLERAGLTKSNFSKYAGLLGLAVFAYFTGLDKYIRAILLPKGIKLVSGIFKGFGLIISKTFGKIGPFAKAWNFIATPWRNFVYGFKNVGKVMEGVVKTPVAIKEFTGFFSKMGATLGKILGPNGAIMKGFRWVGNIFSAIGKFFGKLFGSLGVTLKTGAKLLALLKGIPVLGWVITIIFGIFDFISGFIKGFASQGEDDQRGVMEKLWDGMTDGIIKAIKGILTIPLDLLTKGVAYLLGFLGFDNVKADLLAWVNSGGFTGMFDTMVETIGKAIDTIIDWFKLLFTDPIGALWTLAAGAVGILLDWTGWIWDHTLGPVVDWISTLFGAKEGEIKAAIDKKLGTWRTAFVDFGTWIYNKIIKPVVDFFTTLFTGDVKAAFKKLWDDSVSAFADFGNWIYNKAIKPIVDWFGTLFGGKEGEASKALEKKIGTWLTAIKDFGGWIYDKSIKPIVDWFGTLFKDPVAAIKKLWNDFVKPYVDFGKWIYNKAIEPVIVWFKKLFGGEKEEKGGKKPPSLLEKAKILLKPLLNFGDWIYKKTIEPVVEWANQLFGEGDKKGDKKTMTIAERWNAQLKNLLNFTGWIYGKTIGPVVEWAKNLFGSDKKEGKGDKKAGKTIGEHVGDKLDILFNLPMTIYEKYIKPVVKWISDLFGSDADKPGESKSIMSMFPDLSGLMPSLPTWKNIRKKIGSLLNDMLQGLAKMVDVSLVPDAVSEAFANVGVDTAGKLGVTTAKKYNVDANKMDTIDVETGETLTAAQVKQRRVDAAALKAKQDAARQSINVRGGDTTKLGDHTSIQQTSLHMKKKAGDSSYTESSTTGAEHMTN